MTQAQKEDKLLQQQQITNRMLGIFSIIGVPILTWILLTLVDVKAYMAASSEINKNIETRVSKLEGKMDEHFNEISKIEGILPKKIKLEKEK